MQKTVDYIEEPLQSISIDDLYSLQEMVLHSARGNGDKGAETELSCVRRIAALSPKLVPVALDESLSRNRVSVVRAMSHAWSGWSSFPSHISAVEFPNPAGIRTLSM